MTENKNVETILKNGDKALSGMHRSVHLSMGRKESVCAL